VPRSFVLELPSRAEFDRANQTFQANEARDIFYRLSTCDGESAGRQAVFLKD
jgi:hypothetical protein